MSGKRNVSVCRGHELANALYFAFNYIHSRTLDMLIETTVELEVVGKAMIHSGSIIAGGWGIIQGRNHPLRE